MATRKRRARNADGTLKGDNPATPEVNEAWEDAPVAEEAAPEAPLEEAQASEEAPADEAPAPVAEVVAEVKEEAPAAVEPPASAPVEPKPHAASESAKPMTEERLAEIRSKAFSPLSEEKAEVEKIIQGAGVEKTRGREIAARLMYNARRNGGFI